MALKSELINIIELLTGSNIMEKYACINCGYIYDPEKGDPLEGIEPGTSFEGLPDGWLCPDCGVGKDEFELVKA